MDIAKRMGIAGLCGSLLGAWAGVAGAFGIDDLKKPFLELGNPKFELTIDHPPAVPLKVTTVAIGRPEGECSDGVATRVEEDFVQAGVTVIDRQRLADVLAEHKLQVTALVDQKTATKIGALLGAQALVFLKVLDCHANKSQQELYTDKKTLRSVYSYTVQGAINGSLRVVDLTSGRVLAAQRFEGTGRLQSNDAYPAPEAALGEAEKSAALAIHKVLLPWKETKRLVFFDDSQCDLKTASSLLRAQDLEGALKQSEVNLAACRDKPKVKPTTIARAHYNLGVLQFMLDDYDTALANLTEAQKLQSSQVYIDTIADCRRAKELAAAVAKYEDDRAALATADEAGSAKGGKAAASAGKSKNAATQPAAGTAQAAAGTLTIEDRLAKLEALLKKKLITQDEYNQKRAKILGEI